MANTFFSFDILAFVFGFFWGFEIAKVKFVSIYLKSLREIVHSFFSSSVFFLETTSFSCARNFIAYTPFQYLTKYAIISFLRDLWNDLFFASAVPTRRHAKQITWNDFRLFLFLGIFEANKNSMSSTIHKIFT